jgi:spermidine/putrescine transport system ATP-binding protein
MDGGRIEQLGDPTTLYELPTTTFAANFLGQSNLLPATVVGRDGEDLVVDVHGARMAVPAARTPVSNGAMWLGIRPEKLRVLLADESVLNRNTLSGTVTDASFIGVSTHYLVRLPWGQEITVVQQNDGTPPLRPGEAVSVAWDRVHGFGLDASQDAHAGEQYVAGDDAALAESYP